MVSLQPHVVTPSRRVNLRPPTPWRWLAVAATLGGLALGGFVPGATGQSLRATYSIPYQTTLRNVGVDPGTTTPYRGDAYFKFVLYRQNSNAAPRVPIWSHDPAYLANLDPGRVVEVPSPARIVRVGVPDGVASVYLGGADGVLLEVDGTLSTALDGLGRSVPRLMSSLEPAAFTGGAVLLRVWLGKTTTDFELLTPDLPLAASPFALRAAVADAVLAKGITAAALNDDLATVLNRVATVVDRADDPQLLSLGFGPVRTFPAAPYQRVGRTAPPTGRLNHVAAWTGTELVVFGGAAVVNGDPLAGGARYRPSNDAWSTLPTSGAPSARVDAVSVWTGDRWLIWGGVGTTGLLSDGGSFDPQGNRWESLPPVPTGFMGRRWHTAVWTGSRLLIWGGLTLDGPVKDGAAYDPVGRTWQLLPAFPGVSRYLHSAVWTGSQMIVWGGQTLESVPRADGFAFAPGANPAAGTWEPLPAAPLAARHSHSGFWTPSGMVIFGGRLSAGTPVGDGAIWDSPGGWRSVPDPTGFLVPAAQVRGATTTVGLYLLGGATTGGASGSAAYLDVAQLRWHAAPSPGPVARLGHTVVALPPGNEVMIYGGADPVVFGAFSDLWRLPAERAQYLYRKP